MKVLLCWIIGIPLLMIWFHLYIIWTFKLWRFRLWLRAQIYSQIEIEREREEEEALAIIQITHEESFGALFSFLNQREFIFLDLRNWKTDIRKTRVGNLPMSVTTKCEAFTTITAKVCHSEWLIPLSLLYGLYGPKMTSEL